MVLSGDGTVQGVVLSGDGNVQGVVLSGDGTVQAVVDLRGDTRDAHPLGTQILSISCSFWENLAKLYVGTPPPPRGVGAPSLG